MKFAIAILCLLPFAFAEKRFVVDSLLNVNEIKNLVNTVVGQFGTDATEQQCEGECKDISTNNILDQGCDLLCLEFQSLVKQYYHPPATAST